MSIDLDQSIDASSEDLLVATNGGSAVMIEVGFNANENAKFASSRIRPLHSITQPQHISEVSDRKIIIKSSNHFWFRIQVNAQSGTPFTIKLSTSRGSNGWFEARGFRYRASHGGTVLQTFNASEDGFDAIGDSVLTVPRTDDSGQSPTSMQ